MKLNDRNLSYQVPSQFGNDVALLQFELSQLGFTIPEDEKLKANFGIGTHRAVVAFQRKFGSDTLNGEVGIVDSLTAALMTEQFNKLLDTDGSRQFVLRGTIIKENGIPAPNLTVKAYDVDLRNEEELGSTTTDTLGRYEIGYSSRQFRRTEKKSADLLVRVYAGVARREQLLVTSSIIFNSPPVVTIDLSVGEGEFVGISEYEQMINEISPLMGDVTWDEIAETENTRDISFISAETGLKSDYLKFIVISNSSKMKRTRIPPEAFYGLFRGGLPTVIPKLLFKSLREHRSALEISIRNKIIPFMAGRQLDSIIDRLRQLKIEYSFISSTEDTKERRVPLGTLLASSIKSTSENQSKLLTEKFLTLYWNAQEESKPIPEFWSDLRKNHPELREHIENLQMAIQFSAITHGHGPLIKKIQSMQLGGKVKSLRDLAKLDKDDWIAIMRSNDDDGKAVGSPADIPGSNPQEKIDKYASIIVQIIEDAFPTAVFTQRLQKQGRSANKDLIKFFNTNPAFDLSKDYVEKYVKDKPQSLNGISDKDVLKLQLKKYQRIFKLTGRYEDTQFLIENKLESAHAISKLGRNVFTKKCAKAFGDERRAEKIYDNAVRVSAMAMHVLTSLSPRFNGVT